MHAHLTKFEVSLRYLSADNMEMRTVKVNWQRKFLQQQGARNIQGTEGIHKIDFTNFYFL